MAIKDTVQMYSLVKWHMTTHAFVRYIFRIYSCCKIVAAQYKSMVQYIVAVHAYICTYFWVHKFVRTLNCMCL